MKKRIKIIYWGLLIMSMLITDLPENVFSAERGLVLESASVSIPDSQGNPIRLYEESHALVMGISNYTNGWPSLPGVKTDVEEVKTMLEEQGFNVVLKMDLDHITLDRAFDEFISQYGHSPHNRLLFYFAGHGHTVKTSYGEELGYIVPSNAPSPVNELPEFQSTAMEMQQIEIYAKRIQSKHALFLFDACFSGSLFSLSRAIPANISDKTAKPVRQFITSGSADETVPDDSIFRSQFVRGLKDGEADSDGDGFVTGTELGNFLQDTVVNYSNASQHPQYGKIRNRNLDQGDFVFSLPKFRINNIVITDANGMVIEAEDDSYSIKLGEPVTITVDVESPPNHSIEANWIPRKGNILTTEETNTYIAQKSGPDYVIIHIRDLKTGDELEEPIGFTVVP